MTTIAAKKTGVRHVSRSESSASVDDAYGMGPVTVIPPGCTMAEPKRNRAPLPVALDRDDEPTSPDTPAAQTELVEAIEWLRKRGIVSDSKPPFAGFYEELVDRE